MFTLTEVSYVQFTPFRRLRIQFCIKAHSFFQLLRFLTFRTVRHIRFIFAKWTFARAHGILIIIMIFVFLIVNSWQSFCDHSFLWMRIVWGMPWPPFRSSRGVKSVWVLFWVFIILLLILIILFMASIIVYFISVPSIIPILIRILVVIVIVRTFMIIVVVVFIIIIHLWSIASLCNIQIKRLPIFWILRSMRFVSL